MRWPNFFSPFKTFIVLLLASVLFSASGVSGQGENGDASAGSPGEYYDLIIKGGTVIDGTGRPGIISDIGIRDGKIRAVGNL
ncbi:MAG: hypothetical protein HYY09_02895, partial [Firmicutes bacterium]|nr:hypothetical protein [Bacillota bacterium]